MAHAPRSSATEVDWPSWFASRFLEWPSALRGMLDEQGLKVEQFQDGEELVVRAEMPGIDPEKDVEITVSDGTLRLRAERRSTSEAEDRRGYRSEFRYGAFSRLVPLPAGATADDVKASYADGILEVRIPVEESAAEARRIPIERR